MSVVRSWCIDVVPHLQSLNVSVCCVLTVLHGNKLSHTDLKPENILFVNSDFEVIDVIRPGKSKKVKKSADNVHAVL